MSLKSSLNIALEKAVNARNCNEVKILLAAGADINHTVNQYLDTMLHKAKSAGIARDLLGYSANVNAKNLFDQTPLHSVVIEGRQAGLVETLLEHDANVNARDSKGLTPLHYAIKNKVKNAEVIKFLIMYKANVSHDFLLNEMSPLSTAMLEDDFTGVQALIKYTLLRNFQDSYTDIINLKTYYRTKHFHNARMYMNECGSEILRMKSKKLSDKVTLFQLIMSECIPCESLYKDPESIQLFTKRSFEVLASDSYLRYRDVIIEKLRKKSQVSGLRNMLNIVHISSVSMDSNKKEHVTLNPYINSSLAKYLSKDDLFNLVLASFEPSKCRINQYELNLVKRALNNIGGSSAVASFSKRMKLT